MNMHTIMQPSNLNVFLYGYFLQCNCKNKNKNAKFYSNSKKARKITCIHVYNTNTKSSLKYQITCITNE